MSATPEALPIDFAQLYMQRQQQVAPGNDNRIG